MSTAASALDAPVLSVRTEESIPVLVIPDGVEFDALRDWMRPRLDELSGTFDGRAIRLDLGDRDLQLFDVRRLLHFFREELDLEVTGLYVRSERIRRFAERELKIRLFSTDDVPAPVLATIDLPADETPTEEPTQEPESTSTPVDAPSVAPVENLRPGRRTLSVHRTLRSGATIRYDGDVVVFGDVNPGAEIVASGNVVVLGALRGVAHAGATGDEQAFILGFDLRPTQLRIARLIAISPENAHDAKSAEPEIAQVIDGSIVPRPYREKLR